MASGRAASPQNWNRYSYVLNNPGKLVDPTGLQDDDTQTFSFTPCEYGTSGCNPPGEVGDCDSKHLSSDLLRGIWNNKFRQASPPF